MKRSQETLQAFETILPSTDQLEQNVERTVPVKGLLTLKRRGQINDYSEERLSQSRLKPAVAPATRTEGIVRVPVEVSRERGSRFRAFAQR